MNHIWRVDKQLRFIPQQLIGISAFGLHLHPSANIILYVILVKPSECQKRLIFFPKIKAVNTSIYFRVLWDSHLIIKDEDLYTNKNFVIAKQKMGKKFLFSSLVCLQIAPDKNIQTVFIVHISASLQQISLVLSTGIIHLSFWNAALHVKISTRKPSPRALQPQPYHSGALSGMHILTPSLNQTGIYRVFPGVDDFLH